MKIRHTGLLSLLVGLMLLAACTEKTSEIAQQPDTVRDVVLVAAERAPVPNVLEAVGTVRAAQQAQVASQMMGTVVSISVNAGDSVKRGQLLARIEDAQPRASVESAQAAADAANHEYAAASTEAKLAETTLKRYESLFEKRSVSPQEIDEVRARAEAARARVEMARAGVARARSAVAQANTTYAYTRLVAPFDGVVTERRVDPGALASPGMPLFTIEKAGQYRLEASVDESGMSAVRLGATVPIVVDALGAGALNGRVAQIVPAADPSSRSFMVKIDLPATPQVRSGLFARARFVRGERESILVPRHAVIERGQLHGVYVLSASKIADLRYITVGSPASDKVEVLSGLSAGEQIVAVPEGRDLAGKKIEVR